MLRLDPTAFGASRDAVLSALEAEGIPCSAGYGFSLPAQPLFRNKAFGPYLAGAFAIGWTTAAPVVRTAISSARRASGSNTRCCSARVTTWTTSPRPSRRSTIIATRLEADDRAADAPRWAGSIANRVPGGDPRRDGGGRSADDRRRPLHDRGEPAGSRLGRDRSRRTCRCCRSRSTATFGVLAIVACAAIAYELGRSFGQDAFASATMAVVVLLMISLDPATPDVPARHARDRAGCSPRSSSRWSAVRVQKMFTDHDLVIRMPAGVPAIVRAVVHVAGAAVRR